MGGRALSPPLHLRAMVRVFPSVDKPGSKRGPGSWGGSGRGHRRCCGVPGGRGGWRGGSRSACSSRGPRPLPRGSRPKGKGPPPDAAAECPLCRRAAASAASCQPHHTVPRKPNLNQGASLRMPPFCTSKQGMHGETVMWPLRKTPGAQESGGTWQRRGAHEAHGFRIHGFGFRA